MKKILSLLTAVAMLSGMFAGVASAAVYYDDKYKAIPSVRIKVETGELDLGDELSDSADSYVSVPENDYYTLDDAEWIDSVYQLKVGDAPRMRVWLSNAGRTVDSSHYSTYYEFRGSYTSSNVHITNGEFISAAKRDSGDTLEVVLRIDPVKGTYDSPISADWNSQRGMASWEEPTNGSGYYDVICYRGSSVVKRLDAYHGTSYNFYPYMTKEGDYSFKVRTVSASSSTGSGSIGKKSDWMESGVLTIEANQVSDGSGQTTADEAGGNQTIDGNSYPNGTGNANVAGWIQQGSNYYFRYPNGTYVKDGWLNLNGTYYMFDSTGRMLTGWQQNKNGIWFYMGKDGKMRTGWLRDGDYWYFLNTTKDDFEGCMVRGWWTWEGRKYYFNESGVMVTGWYQVDGNWYYFYPEGSTNGGPYGYMATNTDIGVFHVDSDGVWRG